MAATARRLKKNSKRGHVATPDLVIQPGEIPGVPAFQGGGGILNLQPPTVWGENPPPTGLPEGWQAFPGAPGYFLDRDGNPQYIPSLDPTRTAGGGGPAWRPGEQELQRLQLGIQQDRLELDRAIADQNFALQREIQDRIDQRELVSNMIRARIAGYQGEVAQRGQDLQAVNSALDRLLQDSIARMADARARGDQALERAAMEDARAIADVTNRLQQAELEVRVRGQDIEAGTRFNELLVDAWEVVNKTAIDLGNLELGRFAQERLAAQQRQQVALDQYDAALAGQGLRVEAQRGAATQMTQLASQFGQIEARNRENLLEMAANPRDWAQLQIAMGGGQNPLAALMQGRTPGGQSVGRIQGPTLGADFGRLVAAATERRDIPYFEEARGMIRGLQGYGQQVPQAPSLGMLQGLGRVPQMGALPTMAPQPTFQMPNLPGFGPIPGLEDFLRNLAPLPEVTPPPPKPVAPGMELPPWAQFRKGGQLVIREPTVGVGMISGRPLFTLVEDGKPETLKPIPGGMEVVPFQKGGKMNWWDASRLTKKPATGQRRTSGGGGMALSQPGTVAPPGDPPFAPGTPAYDAWKIGASRLPGTVAPPGPPPFAPGTPEYDAWKDQIAAGASPNWGIDMPPDAVTGDPWGPAPPAYETPPGWRPPAGFVPRQVSMPNFPGQNWGFWKNLPGGAQSRLSVPGQDWTRSATGLDVSVAYDQNGQQVRMVRNPITGETRTQIIGQNMSEVFPEIVSSDAARREATQLEGVPSFNRSLAAQRFRASQAAPATAPSTPVDPYGGRDPGDMLRNIMQGLTPQVWQGMSPSGQQMILSIASYLGVPDEDFMASLQNQWPTGPDPSQLLYGNF